MAERSPYRCLKVQTLSGATKPFRVGGGKMGTGGKMGCVFSFVSHKTSWPNLNKLP